MLSWQYVIIQVSEKERVVDPVLAFARDQTIYFYQVALHFVLLVRVLYFQLQVSFDTSRRRELATFRSDLSRFS